MTRTRSAVRNEFLSDVLFTACYQATDYWARHEVIEQEESADSVIPNYLVVRFIEFGDGDDTCSVTGKPCTGHVVDRDSIGFGIRRYVEKRYRGWELVRDASKENDAGDIDANLADNIVQMAIFGDLVYA